MRYVGMDVDGVVADFVGWADSQWPIVAPSMDRQEWFVVAIEQPQTWVSLPALHNASAAMDRLISNGVYPIFLSHFPERFVALRHWWLSHVLNIQNPTIYSVLAEDKVAAAKAFHLSHFIEDLRTTANAMAQAGINSTLVPRSYPVSVDIHPHVHVRTLDQWVDAVLGELCTSTISTPGIST